MKKFIVYVVCVFVTGFSAYFVYDAVLSSRYAGTVGPYIQRVLPEISTWNPNIARQYMAPEILKTVTAADLDHLMEALSKIGSLQKIGKMSFKSQSEVDDVEFEKRPLITYEVDAQYSTGDTKITISLLDRNGSYELYHFNFQSKALAP
ncbi:hypothetical protein SAMN05660420_00320 [Desulfuromusa kysingii]|uniref:DUF3887 domain-containing protein n=1 Tax=Desulfuromusa kysingii TaxID=37625 RepID=A0A1H3VVY5_9BACT|nr:hypothetical protein [Desulfuromusa kysingii]SDZ79015.1 hypothetical protein SAMN05660420_00320 [Desulfuromusa kysingii]